ncbi:Crp/Fnr family transcriptional regulator [soil metagenome]
MDAHLFLQTHRTPKLTDDDRDAFCTAFTRELHFAPREMMVREGVAVSQCTLVTKGFVQRFKDARDGKRQILAIHIPGDFVDLHSYPLKRLEHSVSALTATDAIAMPHANVRALTERSATLTELMWRSTMIDAAINREWLLNVGTRDAAARIGHLFCELWMRMERVGLAEGYSFAFPLTQTDIGDATALTSVHVNRMLRQLREDGLADTAAGRVTILDWARLARFSEFEPGYLFFD